MTIVDVLKHYQGDRSLREYARLLGIAPSTLAGIYSGFRNPGNEVLRGFVKAFPAAAGEYATAVAGGRIEADKEPTEVAP